MSVVKKTAPTWEKDGYLLRLARREDADAYFSQNYDPLDPEVARFTGCKAHFTREEVISFFLRCLEAEDRYDFLILSPEDRIIGESVINEIDPQLRCADFRIALFQREHRGRGSAPGRCAPPGTSPSGRWGSTGCLWTYSPSTPGRSGPIWPPASGGRECSGTRSGTGRAMETTS